MSLKCPYCGNTAKLVTGKSVYPHLPELYGKYFYMCEPCEAWVGCHPGTKTPLGRLANMELRRLKSAAHAAFDPLWRAKIRRDKCTKAHARGAGYAWLADKLGIKVDECHIGMFDESLCRKVSIVCEPYGRRSRYD